jgi:hypothetical protein
LEYNKITTGVQHFQVTKITKKSSLVNQFNREQIKTAVGRKKNIKLEFWGWRMCGARRFESAEIIQEFFPYLSDQDKY